MSPEPVQPLSNTPALSEQVRRGMQWIFFAQVGTQVFWLFANPTLYRLLDPKDYGLYNTVTVALGFLSAIASLGFGAAIIQRAEVHDGHVQTAFWTSAGAGLIVAGLGAISMPFVAWLYENPNLLWPGVAYALTFLITPLLAIPMSLLSRQMRFQKQVLVNFLSIALNASSSVIFAYLGFGPWSLVLGGLLAQPPAAILACYLAGFRPRLHFRRSELRDLSRFSFYQAGEQAVNFLVANIDYLTVGYFLGAREHGFYTQAFNLTHFPLLQLAPVVRRVMFPALSRQQDDDAALRRGYLQVTRSMAVLTGPILCFFGVAADFIVGGYLGEKWLPIVPYVRILAVIGWLKCVVTWVGLIYNAKGRNEIGFYWNILIVFVMFFAMQIGVRYGVEGVCWAWMIVFIPQGIAIKGITHSLISLKARDYLREMAAPFFFTLLFLGGLLLARFGLEQLLGEERIFLTGFLLLFLSIPAYALGVRLLCPALWQHLVPRRFRRGE